MFDAGAIVGRLILDKKGFDSAVKTAQLKAMYLSDKLRDMGNESIASGRKLSRLGSQLSMIGGLALTPLILLAKQASKESAYLNSKFEDLSLAMQDMRNELVSYLVPWIEKLTSLMQSLSTWFSNLSPIVKKIVIDFGVFSSTLLLITGLIVKLSGLFIILQGAIFKATAALIAFSAAHPLIAIIIGTSLLTTLFIKFKQKIIDIGLAIRDTFYYGFAGIGDFILSILFKVEAAILSLILKLPMLPKKFKASLEEMRFHANELSTSFAESSSASFRIVGESWKSLFEEPMQKAKTKFDDFTSGLKSGFIEVAKNISNFGQLGADTLKNIFSSMETMFSDTLVNLFTGKLDDIVQVFADFGNQLIRMVANIVTRIIMYFAIVKPLAASLGIPTSVLGFSEGTESVPYTGIYRIHEGEKITPKYDATKGDAIELTIVNQITPETVAAAMSGKEGQGVIINTIDTNALRNGSIRKTIRRR